MTDRTSRTVADIIAQATSSHSPVDHAQGYRRYLANEYQSRVEMQTENLVLPVTDSTFEEYCEAKHEEDGSYPSRVEDSGYALLSFSDLLDYGMPQDPQHNAISNDIYNSLNALQRAVYAGDEQLTQWVAGEFSKKMEPYVATGAEGAAAFTKSVVNACEAMAFETRTSQLPLGPSR